MSHKDVALWERIKAKVMADDKGGRAGQWSAIKAMIASKEYKKAGGTYIGKKDTNKGLLKWIGEDWRTKSGQPSLKTGERFLPAKAIKALTEKQYKKTSAIKRRDTKKGKQFSKQPKDIEEIVDRFR
jgi:hypothetical protein